MQPGLTLDTNAQTVNFLLAEIAALKGAYESATRHLDAMTGKILGMDNAELAAFGNYLGPQEMSDLLTAHATHGGTVNGLSESAESWLAKAMAREPITPRLADVAPFSDKLAAQYRAITFDGATYAVVDLPRPEPDAPGESSLAS